MWIKLFRWLNERLPAPVDDVLRWRFPYILPFKNLHIPIAILRGLTHLNGYQGTVIVAGAEHRVDYLVRRFFEGEPRRETLGNVPLWNLASTLKSLRTSADLTIAHVDQLSARMFFGADYLAVPGWVGSSLTIPEDLTKLAKRNHSLKEDLRIARRNGLTSEVAQSKEDFDVFYHTMYVPSVRNRYGEQAVIRDIHRMRRVFRQGGVQWIRRSGQPIAGRILQKQGQILKFVIQGTVNGERSSVKAGAIAALHFFGINHAKELGCKYVDFGGSRPSLKDGVLRYKRKWGVNLIENRDSYYDFLVYWNRLDKPLASFLSNTPLIFRDNNGLSAVYIINREDPVNQADVLKIHHSMWIPGLQRLYLIATSGWQPVHDSPPQTTLIDLTEVGDCNPRALQALGSK